MEKSEKPTEGFIRVPYHLRRFCIPPNFQFYNFKGDRSGFYRLKNVRTDKWKVLNSVLFRKKFGAYKEQQIV